MSGFKYKENYLCEINDPCDLNALNVKELEQLSDEIRQFIIQSVLKTGGHLASSLGVVDLTVAMHYVFDSPKDKIIFDVGHQAYAHKIICGRKDQFGTIRQYKGLSGFLKPHESEHDIFAAGHCSTSISAGLGIARARDLEGEDYSVISVIGDGALTGGMAYEGLNDAGHFDNKFIIVLNDNEMSIAENVGAIHRNLSGLRANAGYIRIKKGVAIWLKRIPLIGNQLFAMVNKLKHRLKYLFVKGVLFEELGFTYIGIVDGHDMNSMIKALNQAKAADKPVIVHVHTKKGKGYLPAEKDPESYHGISAQGKKSNVISNSQVFGDKLLEMAKTNDKIVAISAAMPKGTGLDAFKKQLSNRFFDVGIAEQHGVTMGAGFATQGYIPVFAVYSSFLQRAYDQVLHDVCMQNLHVIFAVDRAGLVGADGETHHGVYDLSYLSHIPNITILSPSTAKELEEMIVYAVKLNKPTVIRYPRGSFERTISDISKIDRWEEIFSPQPVTVIATGNHVHSAIQAIGERNVGLYNARIIKPLDQCALDEIANTAKKIVVIEDNAKIGGLGSLIESYYNENCVDIGIVKMGIPDKFVTHGSLAQLNEEIGLSVADIRKNID